jgi:hypothetical protein
MNKEVPKLPKVDLPDAPNNPFFNLTKEEELIEIKKMLDSIPEGVDKGELPMRIAFLELEIKNK